MNLNFRLGWFRIELMPKPRIVFDARRTNKNILAPAVGLAAVKGVSHLLTAPKVDTNYFDYQDEDTQDFIKKLSKSLAKMGYQTDKQQVIIDEMLVSLEVNLEEVLKDPRARNLSDEQLDEVFGNIVDTLLDKVLTKHEI